MMISPRDNVLSMGQATCSVIIPAFNHARHLERSIGAALAQTFRDIEVIVVDDGSTDDTPDVMSRLTAPNVIYIRTDNGGPGRARNVGIRASTGEYIQFLDADDHILPEKVAAHVKLLEEDATIDVVYCESAMTEPDGTPVEAGASVPLDEADPLKLLIITNPIATSSALLRKSAILKVGLFDETREFQEDWDLWLRMVLSGCRIKYVSGRLAHYKRGAHGVTADTGLMFRRNRKLLDKYIRDDSLKAQMGEYYDSFIAGLYLQLFSHARELRWWGPSRSLLYSAARLDPTFLKLRHWLYFPEMTVRIALDKIGRSGSKVPDYARDVPSFGVRPSPIGRAR